MRLGSIRKRLLKQRSFRALFITSVFSAVFMGIIIVPVEQRDPKSTIQTYSDGMWWSIQTLTTVGYGDVTPHTEIGRFMGMLMQLVGAVMFGALIAMISSSMGRGQEEFYWNRLFERIDLMEKRLADLEKSSGFLVKDRVLHQTKQMKE